MKPTTLRAFVAFAVLVSCWMGISGCFRGRVEEPRRDDRVIIEHHDDHHDWHDDRR